MKVEQLKKELIERQKELGIRVRLYEDGIAVSKPCEEFCASYATVFIPYGEDAYIEMEDVYVLYEEGSPDLEIFENKIPVKDINDVINRLKELCKIGHKIGCPDL